MINKELKMKDKKCRSKLQDLDDRREEHGQKQ